MTTAKVGMKSGSEHQEAHFRAREGWKLIPEAEGRQGHQARTPSSDGEPLPRGEGFRVGVT